MKRRLFLGLMSAVGAGGPKALAKAAAPVGLESLAVGTVATGVDLHSSFEPDERRKESASKWLKQLLGISKEEDEFNMRCHYLHQLDPDTACLRSMSIGAKMARSQRIQYFRQKRMQERRYRGILSDIFSGNSY